MEMCTLQLFRYSQDHFFKPVHKYSIYVYIWFQIISRLAGLLEDGQSDVQHACFIRAPMSVTEVLRCEVADTLSCLMVTGSEELVSRVVRVKVQDGASIHFPVTVVLPFCTRYRGSYRDVIVKVVDGERRASYITPVTTEGTYGGQRVKVTITSLH